MNKILLSITVIVFSMSVFGSDNNVNNGDLILKCKINRYAVDKSFFQTIQKAKEVIIREYTGLTDFEKNTCPDNLNENSKRIKIYSNFLDEDNVDLTSCEDFEGDTEIKDFTQVRFSNDWDMPEESLYIHKLPYGDYEAQLLLELDAYEALNLTCKKMENN